MYKQIEARIDGDGKKGKEARRRSTQNIKGNHKTDNVRASSVIKRKKKEEEIKNSTMIDETKKALSKSTYAINKSVNKRNNKTIIPDGNHETKKTKVINHNNSIDLKGEFTLKNSKSKYSSKEIKDEDVFLTTSKTKKNYNHLRSSMNYRYNGNKDMIIKKTTKKNLNNSTRKIDDLSEYFTSNKHIKKL